MAATKDQLLNPTPGKHYRRTYNVREVYAGAVVIVCLAVLTSWIVYRGSHPDPELFADAPGLVRRDAKPAAVDRQWLPQGLAPDGWTERGLSSFDTSNLFVKINGREGFFKSFGFQQLLFVTLEKQGDPSLAIDVELYDLGTAGNALGCFTAESPGGATVEQLADGLFRADRNAAYLTRGKVYIRAVAAEESTTVKVALAHIRAVLTDKLAGEALPWSYGAFVAGLGLPPGSVSYTPANAFSFAFADHVHSALLADEETELFLSARPTAAAAQAMAKQFNDGFAEMGEVEATVAGVGWVKDQYLARYSGARAEGRVVIGVRGGASAQEAGAQLEKLASAVAALPQGAIPAELPTAAGSGGYDDAEPASDEAEGSGDGAEPGGAEEGSKAGGVEEGGEDY